MLVSCVGALLAGGLVSRVLPFVPFACALTLAICIGWAWAVFEGVSLGYSLLSAAVLLVCTQVGYGLGLLAVVVLGGTREAFQQPPETKGDSSAMARLPQRE